jgi:hypothetical protein
LEVSVTRFCGTKKILTVFFPFICVAIAAAASPDPRLLSLAPPGAQIVSGISAAPAQGQPDNFVLITHSNTVDLEDFFALTGADGTRSIHQIVFVAVATQGQLNEHSLLVSGHFDQPKVFQSATGGGAAVKRYRGVPILEIQPFARERDMFHDVRWLAILDSSVLVFGSIASTRLELDRYLDHSPADESLFRRLASLRSKDQTWCLLSGPTQPLFSSSWAPEIYGGLAKINPDLAELSQVADELEFGLYYGRHVEFEYKVVPHSLQGDRSSRTSYLRFSPRPPNSASLLPDMNATDDAKILHGVVQVSVSRYKEWLSQIRRPRIGLR